MKLNNKRAVITGGSRGIGYAVAKAFAENGASLVLFARSKDELEAAKKALAPTGAKAEIFVGDVSKKEDVKGLIKHAVKTLGGIDVLVNAAGVYGAIGAVEEVDIEEWKKTFAINLFGMFSVIQEAVPVFKALRAGKIINFSGGGDGPLPHFSAYNTSKAAVVRFTETLAAEVKEWNIMANAIAPGPVNTKFLDDALNAGETAVGAEQYAKLLKQKEEGGVSPEKAAALCLFLASDASDGLSGKFLSAVWDDYASWDAAKIAEIMKSDMFTLRRKK